MPDSVVKPLQADDSCEKAQGQEVAKQMIIIKMKPLQARTNLQGSQD